MLRPLMESLMYVRFFKDNWAGLGNILRKMLEEKEVEEDIVGTSVETLTIE